MNRDITVSDSTVHVRDHIREVICALYPAITKKLFLRIQPGIIRRVIAVIINSYLPVSANKHNIRIKVFRHASVCKRVNKTLFPRIYCQDSVLEKGHYRF